MAWHHKGEFDKAIADYTQAIRLDPENDVLYFNRALAWGRKESFKNAIADFNEAIRLDSDDNLAYNGRAWLWATCPDARFRDGKKAVESAIKACELTEWKDAASAAVLAAAYAEVGDFDAAAKWQTQANSLYVAAEDRKKGEARLRAVPGEKAVSGK